MKDIKDYLEQTNTVLLTKDAFEYLKEKASVLDNLRAEIDRQEKWLLQAGYTAYNVDIAFDAIKSVLAERTDKE